MDLIPLDHPSIKEDLFCSLTESSLLESRRAIRRRRDERESMMNMLSKFELSQTISIGIICVVTVAACVLLII